METAVQRYNYTSQLHADIDQIMTRVRSMLLEGRYVLTEEVHDFEKRFAMYVGSRFCIGVNCGTDALLISLLALNVSAGDEVVTQANTFNATVAAIERAGARPVLVDADEHSFLIDRRQLSGALTSRTSAIIPVHLYGKPTPMADILQLASRRGIHVVEDAAQAHGARVDGTHAGTSGLTGCFSFHPSKNLAAAGDAGCVVTDSAETAATLERLRSLGQREQNNHVVVGVNSKLDAVQAIVLSAKLAHLEAWTAARARVASMYRSALANAPVTFQSTNPSETHAWHLFQIRTVERDSLLAWLRAHGVDAVVRYPVPIHLQPAFAKWGWRNGQFPVAERLAKELLCLPIRPDMTEQDVDIVAGHVLTYFNSASRSLKVTQ